MSLRQAAIRVRPVPVLSDNYAYLVVDTRTGSAAAVDPAEPAKVRAAAAALGVTLTAVWTTHSHWDHSAGNIELAEQDGLPIYGSRHGQGRIPALSKPLADGETFMHGQIAVTVRHVPYHTRDHLFYYVPGLGGKGAVATPPMVFTGDALFLGGCGRMFDGTAAEMHHALCGVFAAYDPAAQVWCGHEYTVANLKFAAHADPDNADVRAELARAQALRQAGKPTVPGLVATELKTNPFLRCAAPAIAAFTGSSDPAVAIGRLRALKDEWRAG